MLSKDVMKVSVGSHAQALQKRFHAIEICHEEPGTCNFALKCELLQCWTKQRHRKEYDVILYSLFRGTHNMMEVAGKGKMACKKRAIRGGARLCTAVGLTTTHFETIDSTPDLHGDDHYFIKDRGSCKTIRKKGRLCAEGAMNGSLESLQAEVAAGHTLMELHCDTV